MPKLGSRRLFARLLTLFGETTREIGILIVVFAPLESYLRGPAPPFRDVYWLVAFGLLAIVVGITMEVFAEKIV